MCTRNSPSKRLVFVFALTMALTSVALPTSLRAESQISSAQSVQFKTTVVREGGRVGDLDRHLKEMAAEAQVEIQSLRSRVAYSWQVSILKIEGSPENVERFQELLAEYKALHQME